jgi:pullulanase/glycogen debranching enzyme
VPSSVQDLVIYELHIGALGFGHSGEGNLADAMRLLDEHLVPLGINAVELMPIAEFPGAKKNTRHPFHDSGSYSRALGLLLEGMKSGESVATDAASCNGKQQRLREGSCNGWTFFRLLRYIVAEMTLPP